MGKNRLLLFVTLATTFVLAACSNNNKVELWDLVTIAYTGTFLDGSFFEYKEITITAWSGKTIKWIDDAIIGMKSWKSKKIKIKPELWYGDKYNQNDLQIVSKLIFDKLWIKPEINKTIKLDKITWVIKSLEKDWSWFDTIILDINPLETRQDTNYEITIKSINKTNYKL